MKKFIFLMTAVLVFAVAFIGCRSDDSDADVKVTGIDLSQNGTANSYLITSAGAFSFDATVIGNGSVGIISGDFHTNSPTISPVSVKLVWQDFFENGEGLITSLKLNEDNTRVIFTTSNQPNAFGNAVIAVRDADENILWSWHIWKPSVEVTHLRASTGYDIMNINLGAITNERGTAKSYGMLYQWGRKNPFPSAATLTGDMGTLSAPMFDMDGNPVLLQSSSRTDLTSNNFLFSIQNPTTVISRGANAPSHDWLAQQYSSDALWGNPKGFERNEDFFFVNKGVKTIYDPCPPGWRVPPVDAFRFALVERPLEEGQHTTIILNVGQFQVKDLNGDGEITVADDYDHGWVFRVSDGVYSYFPAASRFDGDWAMLMGSRSGVWGTYWSNSSHDGVSGWQPLGRGLVPLSFGTDPVMVTINANAGRADGYSVRCIRE